MEVIFLSRGDVGSSHSPVDIASSVVFIKLPSEWNLRIVKMEDGLLGEAARLVDDDEGCPPLLDDDDDDDAKEEVAVVVDELSITLLLFLVTSKSLFL